MQLLIKTTSGAVFRPAKLAFSVLRTLPDRPPGTHELCPTIHLDAETITQLRDTQSIDTVTGLLTANEAGWLVIGMRRAAVAVIMALDIGDKVVQRWLADAPSLGPVVGIWSPTAAGALRLPVTDALREIQRRASCTRPADRQDKGDLFGRLLDCIEHGELSSRLVNDGADPLRVHVALPPGDPAGELASGSIDSLLH